MSSLIHFGIFMFSTGSVRPCQGNRGEDRAPKRRRTVLGTQEDAVAPQPEDTLGPPIVFHQTCMASQGEESPSPNHHILIPLTPDDKQCWQDSTQPISVKPIHHPHTGVRGTHTHPVICQQFLFWQYDSLVAVIKWKHIYVTVIPNCRNLYICYDSLAKTHVMAHLIQLVYD